MIYEKLPIVLLSVISSEKNGTTNSIIASYILEHIDEIKDDTIKDLARKCNVAMSSISRFCKDIGLYDYSELKELLSYRNFYFEKSDLSSDIKDRNQQYFKLLKENVEMVETSIDLLAINKLCSDIKKFDKVLIFGLLKAETVAMNLQTDLMMLSKQTTTKVSFKEQIECLENIDKDTLVLIFSYTGSYFECINEEKTLKNLDNAKIYMITGEQKVYPQYIDEVIYFASNKEQIGHPLQLQIIAQIIAREYAVNYHKE